MKGSKCGMMIKAGPSSQKPSLNVTINFLNMHAWFHDYFMIFSDTDNLSKLRFFSFQLICYVTSEDYSPFVERLWNEQFPTEDTSQ